ncbi:MAG: hypothetical protein IPK16_11545 [Anaerolineales bacterium]|nr:hypothetical protein [Anaerolineales bacterium]
MRWADRDIYAAYLAMADADSITVDPHKLGFTPYPAGIVAFRNGLVTEHVAERAQYISDDAGGIKSIDQPAQIEAVGPYVVEGSKPRRGRTLLLAGPQDDTAQCAGSRADHARHDPQRQKLFKLLTNHRHMFEELHAELFSGEHAAQPFTFVPLFEPDTNIVCFVASPMTWGEDGKLASMPVSIDVLNALNQAIYAATSLAADEAHRARWAVQPFFVSRTRFEETQYGAAHIAPVLQRIGVSAGDYRRAGLFVLRSTVMNPWYAAAEASGVDYLLALMHHLHRVTHTALGNMQPAITRAKTGSTL